jgi:hypothetical protein
MDDMWQQGLVSARLGFRVLFAKQERILLLQKQQVQQCSRQCHAQHLQLQRHHRFQKRVTSVLVIEQAFQQVLTAFFQKMIKYALNEKSFQPLSS